MEQYKWRRRDKEKKGEKGKIEEGEVNNREED